MRIPLRKTLAIAGFGLLLAPAAQAFEPLPLDLPIRDVPVLDEPAPTAAADPTDPFADPLAGESLDALRGGDNVHTVTNISDVDGRVDGNTATNVVSGANLVDGGAFGNAAGLSTVIQNSGNNVLIQNSTVVSIQFAPTP
ncbi:MAG TPA: hypothetical protein VFE72_01420 [Lysobacter sp.]|nr:hypothetical protein [Lysobacter sp.]